MFTEQNISYIFIKKSTSHNNYNEFIKKTYVYSFDYVTLNINWKYMISWLKIILVIKYFISLLIGIFN